MNIVHEPGDGELLVWACGDGCALQIRKRGGEYLLACVGTDTPAPSRVTLWVCVRCRYSTIAPIGTRCRCGLLLVAANQERK